MPVKQMCEIWPLTAPGLPLVGLDFVEEAQLRGDTVSSRKGAGKSVKFTAGPILGDLVRSALYDRGECMLNVTIKGVKKRSMPVISGHVWGRDWGRPSPGPEPSDVMVITKWFEEEEFKASRVFNGPTGQVLMEACERMGIERSEYASWYVTPVVKTANPEGGDNWKAAWEKTFIHLLHQEIRLVKPKYILCMGAQAVKALFPKTTMSKLEGQVLEVEFDMRKSADEPENKHTALVMVCLHPKAVILDPANKDKFELTLARFGQLTRGHRWDQAETDLDHRVIDNEDDLEALVKEVRACGLNNIIGMDAEWHGEHPQNAGSYMRCLQVSWAHKKAACIVLHHAGGEPGFKHYKRVKSKKTGKWIKTTELTTKGAHKTVARLVSKLLEGNRPCGHFFNADLEWLVPMGIDLRKQFAPPEHWSECKTKGGLDTALMAHAFDETGDFSLTGQALRYTAAPRYDVPVIKWKEQYCRENKIKAKDLEGYGECPDEILYPYANYDADVTRRIALEHMKNLDADAFGNNCWEAFWISQRAALTVLEIKMTGIPLDRKRIDELTATYMQVKEELAQKIKEWFKWPELNLQSANHIRELLYGEKLNCVRTADGGVTRLRPEGAVSLFAIPLLTTEKRPRPWMELSEEEKRENTPSTAGKVLGMMHHIAKQLPCIDQETGKMVKLDYKEQIGWLRDYRFIGQILKSVLRPPLINEDDEYVTDDEDNWEYDKGLAGVVCDDGRVRTTIYQTKETGRWSSARPALQNLSKRREPEYQRILGNRYKYPLRSVLCAPEGYVMVEADYIGAELFGMAVLSGDENMIEHVRRNSLPEDDPNFYDIHSNVAKLAFGFDCPATKGGLAAIGMAHMRIVAKSVVFGVAYGRQAKAIALAAKEEGIDISQDEAQRIVDALFELYPGLIPFFAECAARAATKRYDEPAPRWICNAWGRFRRVPDTNDRKLKGDYERQFYNYPLQSLVADTVSLGIANLYDYRENAYANGWTVDDLDYKICLQVHDAIMAFVRYEHVPYFIDTVLQECMINSVPIYPTALDGTPLGTGPYYLGIDSGVYQHWGVTPLPSELEKIGVHWKYAHWKEDSAMVGGKKVSGLVQKEAYAKKIWYKGALHDIDPKK